MSCIAKWGAREHSSLDGCMEIWVSTCWGEVIAWWCPYIVLSCVRRCLSIEFTSKQPWVVLNTAGAWGLQRFRDLPGDPTHHTGHPHVLLCPCCMHAKSLHSCLTLCDSIDCSPPGSSVHGVLQARILEWVALPSSRDSSWTQGSNCVSYISCIGRWVLYH